MTGPIHLQPTAPLAERVLLPGDPGRALRLAQALLDKPKMFNHNRGLWGYSGAALHDGEPLTIQSTGMGGPSAAIVLSELAQLGATTVVRIGTCGALTAELGLGDRVLVVDAICADGTSRALAGGDRVAPSAELARRLSAQGAGELRPLTAVSADLFYDRDPADTARWAATGAAVVELETATVLALARRRGLQAASLLIVVEALAADGRRGPIEAQALHAHERGLGELAVRALSAR